MLKVEILIQDHAANGIGGFRSDWNLKRNLTLEYCIEDQEITEDIAEQAFHDTNCGRPEDSHVAVIRDYRGASLSVGDVVRVLHPDGSGKDFLCASCGWESRNLHWNEFVVVEERVGS